MKSEENNQTKRVRETLIKHERSPDKLTTFQVTSLALQLSRRADETVDCNAFEQNCDAAFEILIKLKKKIEDNANLSSE